MWGYSLSLTKVEKERSALRFSSPCPAVLSSSFAATLSHLHMLPDHLCIQLSIPNCQSQSDFWYIWEVTKYDGERDNISRPLRRTGTLQCALNNRPVQWQKSRLVIESEGTQCSLGGGNWDHVSPHPPTPPNPLQGLEKKQNSLGHNITFN